MLVSGCWPRSPVGKQQPLSKPIGFEGFRKGSRPEPVFDRPVLFKTDVALEGGRPGARWVSNEPFRSLLILCSTSGGVHLWSTSGPPLVHPWSTPGSPLVHLWCTPGAPLVHPWSHPWSHPLSHPLSHPWSTAWAAASAAAWAAASAAAWANV